MHAGKMRSERAPRLVVGTILLAAVAAVWAGNHDFEWWTWYILTGWYFGQLTTRSQERPMGASI